MTSVSACLSVCLFIRQSICLFVTLYPVCDCRFLSMTVHAGTSASWLLLDVGSDFHSFVTQVIAEEEGETYESFPMLQKRVLAFFAASLRETGILLVSSVEELVAQR